MKIYACSDLHVSPEHFSRPAKSFLEEAVQEADKTLLCGDIFEGSWFPLEESINSPKGRELMKLIQKLSEVVVIKGNHDWTLKQYVDFPVLENHSFEMDGKSYYATHGWKEYDLPVGLLAPIYRYILPLLPVLARWWTSRQSPRTLKLAAQKSGGHDLRYWRHVRKMSNRAIFQAIKEARIPIWGHSHHKHIDKYEGWQAINCGDFSGTNVGGIVIQDGEPRKWKFESPG